jgi:radical SAM protein with 4Fe4S-binding SPASM domain
MKFKKIYIEITNACNKNCSFCSKSTRKKVEMSPTDFEFIIMQVKNYTDYVYLHVKGEPLLHSRFEDIINICDKYNMNVNITTNGTFLPKQQELIANSKCVRQVNLSIHSLNDRNEINNILNSVNDIKKRKDIYFVYRYWTLKENLILKDNQILDAIIKHYNLSIEKQQEIEQNGNIKINKYTFINKDKEFVWPSLNNQICNETGYCYGLKTHIAILSDGTVVPCCLDAEGIINLGNIYKTKLEEILNSERTMNIINAFKNNKKFENLCKHCSFINR